jgi:hypothetical protein
MNKGETHLMASAALSMNPDVIGGIEYPIVQACFTRSSIPQSIDDLAISGICLVVLRAVCMMRMASPCVLTAIGGIFRYLRNQDICFNAYILEFTMMII